MLFWNQFRKLFKRKQRLSEFLRSELTAIREEGQCLLQQWGHETDAAGLTESDLRAAVRWAAQVEALLLCGSGQRGPLLVFNFWGQVRFPHQIRPLERPASPDHACAFHGYGDRMQLRHCLQVRIANLDTLLSE
ncbi:MAG: hypothetical protein U0791_05150 [Gemmataceae bacterium]